MTKAKRWCGCWAGALLLFAGTLRADEEFVKLEIQGNLHTGVVAAGGETTGLTITALGTTWELDCGQDARLRQQAERLTGLPVLVRGTLAVRPGVEIAQRRIVTVTFLQAAGEAAVPQNRLEGNPPQPGAQVRQVFCQQREQNLPFLFYLPKHYAEQEKWPLVLFLHGAGERGDYLEMVKRHGPPRLIEEGKEFPFLVVAPQCPRNRNWEPNELLALLDLIGQRYKVDPDRVYVTGLSMGGFATWALAAQAPQRFAAIVPICGGGDPATAAKIAHLPMWVFHGAKDSVVPLASSERIVEAIRQQGVEVKFTVYPEADHDSWTETYANPELYEWLLQQHRGGKPEAAKEKKEQ